MKGAPKLPQELLQFELRQTFYFFSSGTLVFWCSLRPAVCGFWCHSLSSLVLSTTPCYSIYCIHHIRWITLVGTSLHHYRTPSLSCVCQYVTHSPAANVFWHNMTGTVIRLIAAQRHVGGYFEVLQQARTHFGDIKLFLQEIEFSPATRGQL